jgi:hypothetical protein
MLPPVSSLSVHASGGIVATIGRVSSQRAGSGKRARTAP